MRTFTLPTGVEAAGPPTVRDGVRLLVARPGGIEHTRFDRLGEFLAPGDLVVVNTSGTLAAAVGGLRSLVVPGRTGFLVEGRDPATYAACVERLLADPSLAAAMSLEAAALARRFRWSITAARLRRLYADLTARQLVECR